MSPRRRDLPLCPSCDLGLPMPCVCPPMDWRGVPIYAGDAVIYGASLSGSTISLVEARVADDPFVTPSGRIRLNVVRRARYRFQRREVLVQPEHLTVVDELPESILLTDEDHEAAERARVAVVESLDRRSR